MGGSDHSLIIGKQRRWDPVGKMSVLGKGSNLWESREIEETGLVLGL